MKCQSQRGIRQHWAWFFVTPEYRGTRLLTRGPRFAQYQVMLLRLALLVALLVRPLLGLNVPACAPAPAEPEVVATDGCCCGPAAGDDLCSPAAEQEASCGCVGDFPIEPAPEPRADSAQRPVLFAESAPLGVMGEPASGRAAITFTPVRAPLSARSVRSLLCVWLT